MKNENQAGRNSNVAAATGVGDAETLTLSATPKPAAIGTRNGSGRDALNLVGRTLWHLPGSFGIARLLGRFSLRCVLFHDVSDKESPFTEGLGGTITRKNFEAALRFITRYYSPVSLQDVIASCEGQTLPPRPILVTFDDAYASVCEFAAPLCAKFGVPAVFFVNGECLDNRQLALDNLVCYVANMFGLKTINATIQTVEGHEHYEVRSLAEVFGRFLPRISLSARKSFQGKLVELSRIRDSELAGEAGLYLSSKQLRDLSSFNFEIGDHTCSHVHCRSLLASEFAEEIDRNRTTLELVSCKKIRSFSVPYGSSADLTPDLEKHLKRSGYEAIFLAEGCANSRHSDLLRLDRVSLRSIDDAALFSEVEVLPPAPEDKESNAHQLEESVASCKLSYGRAHDDCVAPHTERFSKLLPYPERKFWAVELPFSFELYKCFTEK